MHDLKCLYNRNLISFFSSNPLSNDCLKNDTINQRMDGRLMCRLRYVICEVASWIESANIYVAILFNFPKKKPKNANGEDRFLFLVYLNGCWADPSRVFRFAFYPRSYVEHLLLPYVPPLRLLLYSSLPRSSVVVCHNPPSIPAGVHGTFTQTWFTVEANGVFIDQLHPAEAIDVDLLILYLSNQL